MPYTWVVQGFIGHFQKSHTTIYYIDENNHTYIILYIFITYDPKQLQEFMRHSTCYACSKNIANKAKESDDLHMRTKSPKIKRDNFLF